MPSGIMAERYVFTITALGTLKLPAYMGSTLRGGFGHAFRKVVCAFRARPCDDCLLRHRCVYSYVFETPPPEGSGKMSKYERAPHPFVIEPPPDGRDLYRPGEGFSFGLVLIGRANDYLPYFIYAFEEMGKTGIGRGKGKFRLDGVSLRGDVVYDSSSGVLKQPPSVQRQAPPDASSLAPPSASPDFLSLTFQTPTRLVIDGHLAPNPGFQSIFRTLLRRLSLLSSFHCGRELEVDYKGLIEQAGVVETVKKDIRWWDWERWSNRQDTMMKLGGFVGEMAFSGEFGEFMEFLRMGEMVHVGKGTGFGLGRYEMSGKEVIG